MAGAAQADRAGRDASGGPSGSRDNFRDRSVRRHPIRGAVVGVDVSPVDVRDAAEIERALAAFARSGNGGLIVTASPLSLVHRELIVALAARHKLPAVYFATPLRRRRRPDLLWARCGRPVPARGRLRRSHPQGREAGRPAGAGADQVRTRDQSQDRQGAWPHHSAVATRPRRRGDRIKWPMSAFGTKRTSLFATHMSAFGCKADMRYWTANVR